LFESIQPQEQDSAPRDVALVARQPIFDTRDSVLAYELLFRDPGMKPGLGGKSPIAATATVLIDGFELIRHTLRPAQRLFINFTEDALEAELATVLPPEICVVEILENVRPTPAVLQGLRNLKQQGYQLALDDYTGQEELGAFLPLVDVIKMDITGYGEKQIRRLLDAVRQYNAVLLAEKVEDLDTMRMCRRLDFSLFQGFFFGKAEIVKGKKLSPLQSARFRLLSLTSDEESKINSMADAVMTDVFLAYKLLRYINSVYFGLNRKVDSIKQAIILLGRKNFYQWLCVTALAELDAAPMTRELAYVSALRGKFLEILSRRTHEVRARRTGAPVRLQQNMGPSMFMLGLFSLLESILGIPMEEVLAPLPMEETIVEALTKGSGPYAPWLDLIKAYERGEWDEVERLAPMLGLSSELLRASYAESALWVSEILDGNQLPAPEVKRVSFSLVKNSPEAAGQIPPLDG